MSIAFVQYPKVSFGGSKGGAARLIRPTRGASGSCPAHPAATPYGLCKWRVCYISKPGDVVLDPFCGSGTVGEAALRNGRRSIGIETSEGDSPIFVERKLGQSPIYLFVVHAARRIATAVRRGWTQTMSSATASMSCSIASAATWPRSDRSIRLRSRTTSTS